MNTHVEPIGTLDDLTWPKARTRRLEPVLGKPVTELCNTEEIVRAFDVLGQQRLHKCYGSALLYELWERDQLARETLCRLLLDTWRYTDFPAIDCPPRAWRAMFKVTGYLSDGYPQPRRVRRLYRGSTPHRRRGMSWTTYLPKAREFQDHWVKQRQASQYGNVYTTIAPPSAVLATIRGQLKNIPGIGERSVRSEYEFILDTRGLDIRMLENVQDLKARIEREKRLEAHVAARF